MTDQLLEAYRWIAAQPVDWRAVFVTSHYAGLALALSLALLGDGMGRFELGAADNDVRRRRDVDDTRLRAAQ